jgi:hypothetical protein
MPSAVALQQQDGGEISFIVGEDADESPDTLVIDNIKRYALEGSDEFIRNELELRAEESPVWWDRDTRCVQYGGQLIPAAEIIRRILAEAFRRAGISGAFEWWAGCPVHAGLEYRAELAQVLSGFGGTGRVSSVVEEPILFLALARKIGTLRPGSYLIYDLGGGSFDCTLAEIKPGDGEMIVYGAEGNPFLGGLDIDRALARKLGYVGLSNQLRSAKEQSNPLNAPPLPGGIRLPFPDVVETVNDLGFVKNTLMTVRDTYIQGKFLWRRPLDNRDVPPAGERIYHHWESGAVRFVWQLRWDDMAQDKHLDGVILFGGSTLLGDAYQTSGSTHTRYFREQLAKWFGEDKVFTAKELIQSVDEPELVGASMGACYMAEGSYSSPYVLNRLPARITLQNLYTGEQLEYEPFRHFMPEYNRQPFEPYRSAPLTPQMAAIRSPLYPETYQLTVTDPNGVVLEQGPIDEYIDSRLIGHTLRLVIDRLGWIGVEQESPQTSPKRYLVFESTPWQTGEQLQALREIRRRQREYDEEERRQSGATTFSRTDWMYRN